jgi:hypothetical protein
VVLGGGGGAGCKTWKNLLRFKVGSIVCYKIFPKGLQSN